VTDYNKAVIAHKAEIAYWTAIKHKCMKIHKAQGTSVLNFLMYLNDYLKEKALWLQWLKASVLVAAECLCVLIDSIVQTNNHLESHNRHIKGKYFKAFTHGSRLLCLDHWVQTLVIMAVPKFFSKLANKCKLSDYRSDMCFAVLAGPSLAERESELKLLMAHVLANTDTKDALESESESDSKGLEHNTMCDSSTTGSKDNMHLVSHVSDSEIGIGDLNLEESIDFNEDNALDEDNIVAQLCQPH
jgi:hypothetical protein